MTPDFSPYARIFIRYGTMYMATRSGFDPEFAQTISSDPDLVIVTAGLIGLLNEFWYGLAKRNGGAT